MYVYEKMIDKNLYAYYNHSQNYSRSPAKVIGSMWKEEFYHADNRQINAWDIWQTAIYPG